MSEHSYMVAIAALLPITAGMLITQANPYHALVIRGILGAVAALVYAMFGAADVALTEALVGTMLSITLYAIAVRSSMSMRLGVLELNADKVPNPGSQPLYSALSKILYKYHMRLEVITFPSLHALQSALQAQEIHAICVATDYSVPSTDTAPGPDSTAPYLLTIRLQRLYDIVNGALPAALAMISFSGATGLMPDNAASSPSQPLEILEGQS